MIVPLCWTLYLIWQLFRLMFVIVALQVSNKFYFTFTVRPEAMSNVLRIRKVVPATEEEARRVLERMDAESCQLSKSWADFPSLGDESLQRTNFCILWSSGLGAISSSVPIKENPNPDDLAWKGKTHSYIHQNSSSSPADLLIFLVNLFRESNVACLLYWRDCIIASEFNDRECNGAWLIDVMRDSIEDWWDDWRNKWQFKIHLLSQENLEVGTTRISVRF